MKPIHMAGPWITNHEINIVEDAMRNGWYENSYDYVEKFQREFATFHDRKYGIMTPNCTSAIHLLLAALGISEGHEVILPECTWIATGAGITYLKATPIFCDINSENWCIDPDSIEKLITSRTKALLFAWNHKSEIMEKEMTYSSGGGQWIVYVPQIKII